MTDSRDLDLPFGYLDLLEDLQATVKAARSKALRTVNTHELSFPNFGSVLRRGRSPKATSLRKR